MGNPNFYFEVKKFYKEEVQPYLPDDTVEWESLSDDEKMEVVQLHDSELPR